MRIAEVAGDAQRVDGSLVGWIRHRRIQSRRVLKLRDELRRDLLRRTLAQLRGRVQLRRESQVIGLPVDGFGGIDGLEALDCYVELGADLGAYRVQRLGRDLEHRDEIVRHRALIRKVGQRRDEPDTHELLNR